MSNLPTKLVASAIAIVLSAMISKASNADSCLEIKTSVLHLAEAVISQAPDCAMTANPSSMSCRIALLSVELTREHNLFDRLIVCIADHEVILSNAEKSTIEKSGEDAHKMAKSFDRKANILSNQTHF